MACYQVVSNTDFELFEKIVEDYLKIGWSTAGGVSVCLQTAELSPPGTFLKLVYYQAITHPEDG